MPGGRRPGAPRTREAILEAARAAFSSHGYDSVSVRAIARAAGVDPALVHHYFTGKAALFAAAMRLGVEPERLVAALLEGDRETLGERLVRSVLELWERDGGFAPFLGLIRGAVSHEAAAALLREFVSREILGRLAAAAAPDEPQVRAALAGSQIIGLAMARHVVALEPLARADAGALAAVVGPVIQAYLTAPLPERSLAGARGRSSS